MQLPKQKSKCLLCGRDAIPDRQICESCYGMADMSIERHREKLRRFRHGLCYSCGKNKSELYNHCRECWDRLGNYRKSEIRKVAMRHPEHLEVHPDRIEPFISCGQCGVEIRVLGYSACPVCSAALGKEILPSKAEIIARKNAIRDNWSHEEEQARAGGLAIVHWDINQNVMQDYGD